MGETKVRLGAVMYNKYGCELGSFDLEEVAKLFERGEVEEGDTFKVYEPEE